MVVLKVIPLTISVLHPYDIERNFYLVQTLTVFADDPTIAKIKTVESFNSPIDAALRRALS